LVLLQAAGTAQPSFARDILLDPETNIDEFLLSYIIGAMYIAGSDTVIVVVAALPWLIFFCSADYWL
jgi:hypothetical protein